MTGAVPVTGPASELAAWLERSYERSVRTAYLILGNRADAEDAVQEAFLRAWRFRDSLSKDARLEPWLYRVVVNTCNSILRREIPRRDLRESDAALDDIATPRDAMASIAMSNDIMSALVSLPGALRVVVVLRYYADLSEREIAFAIGRPVGTVKSRLNEARRRLSHHPALSGDHGGTTRAEEAH